MSGPRSTFFPDRTHPENNLHRRHAPHSEQDADAPTPRPAFPILTIPGRNETFHESLGRILFDADVEIGHLDLTGRFLNAVDLSFSTAIRRLAATIRTRYMHDECLLLGRSFGAWLILNALLKVEEEAPFPGTTVLISPSLGHSHIMKGKSPRSWVGSVSPRDRWFWRKAGKRNHPPARQFLIIHGDQDLQCPIDLSRQLHEAWSVPLLEIPGGGHHLNSDGEVALINQAIGRIWPPSP